MAAAAVERPAAAPAAGQRFQGVQKQSAGYRLLAAMGWKEGEGLGASKQGIKSHIRVKKKFENWGVGAVEAAQHAQSWTNGMLDFHRVLSNLSEVVSEHARRAAASDASSSDDDSDALRGEEQQRAGQARGKKSAGRKGAEQKAGKERKKRKAAPASGGSDSDDEAEAEAAPKRVRAATHIGRFKKREAAKMVKAYSQTDLAAIIGVDPFAAAAAQLAEVRADRRDDGGSGYDSDTEPSASGSDGEDRAEGAQEQQQQQQQAVQEQAAGGEAAPPQREMIVVRRPMAGTRPAAPAPQPQEARRPGWWQVCFHRAAGPGGAGAGAGVGSGPAAITIHGFSEQDQTNLYNLAHDKATQGRVGLGRSSMPKKVAGARWAGKKTKIAGSDDEGEEEEEGVRGAEDALQQGPAPGGVQLAAEEGLVIVLPPSKRHLLDQLEAGQQQQSAAAPAGTQQQQQEQQQPRGQPKGHARPAGKKAKKAKQAAAGTAGGEPATAGSAGSSLAGIKWKKAVGAALKASGKARLKLSKLHRAVAKQAGLPKALRGEALDALTAFLQQSTRFELEDGVVRAAA